MNKFYNFFCREKVIVPSSKPFVSFIGDETKASETIITWNNKASDLDANGNALGTYNSATVIVLADYFCATGVTFEVNFQFFENLA